MDPNYLQRIAIAGSRTAAAARPAVTGPPAMPGPVWPSPPPLPADRPLPPAAIASEQRRLRPSPDPGPVRQRGSGGAGVEVKRRTDTGQATAIGPGRAGEAAATEPSATPRVQEGPPPLLPGEPQAAADSRLPPDSETVIWAPRGLRPALPPPPTAGDEPAAEAPGRDAPTGSATRAEIPIAPQPRTEAVVFAPEGLRTAPNPAPAPPDEPATPLRSVVRSPLLPGQERAPVQPALEQRSEAPRDAGVDRAPRQASAAAEPIAADAPTPAPPPVRPPPAPPPQASAAEPGSRPVAAPMQVAAAPPTEPAFLPKPPSMPVMPPSPGASTAGESRISIGRVEVQVNNRLPPAAPVSRPEPVGVSRSATVLLEARYLDRFCLRP